MIRIGGPIGPAKPGDTPSASVSETPSSIENDAISEHPCAGLLGFRPNNTGLENDPANPETNLQSPPQA
ncbi:hypothetical protein DS906_12090 [Ruegeria sp. A3M17]|nr:hypothetical protein DS906_12090 [Ruegeria sp. A3M17]